MKFLLAILVVIGLCFTAPKATAQCPAFQSSGVIVSNGFKPSFSSFSNFGFAPSVATFNSFGFVPTNSVFVGNSFGFAPAFGVQAFGVRNFGVGVRAVGVGRNAAGVTVVNNRFGLFGGLRSQTIIAR